MSSSNDLGSRIQKLNEEKSHDKIVINKEYLDHSYCLMPGQENKATTSKPTISLQEKLSKLKKLDHCDCTECRTWFRFSFSKSTRLTSNHGSMGRSNVEITFEMIGNNVLSFYFRCKVCRSVFRCVEEFKVHEQLCKPGKVTLNCDINNKKFLKQLHLKNHKMLHEDGRSSLLNKPIQSGKLSDSQIKQGFGFKCKFCYRRFRVISRCRTHQMDHTLKVSMLKRNVDELPLSLYRSALKYPFQCTECPMSFVNKERLREHGLTHKPGRPFKCSYCSKSYKLPWDRNLHEIYHTDVKRYRCRLCTKAFRTREDLRIHAVSHKHDGDNLLSNREPSRKREGRKLKSELGSKDHQESTKLKIHESQKSNLTNPKIQELNPMNPNIEESNPTNPKIQESNPPNPKIQESNSTNSMIQESNPTNQRIQELDSMGPMIQESQESNPTNPMIQESNLTNPKIQELDPMSPTIQKSQDSKTMNPEIQELDPMSPTIQKSQDSKTMNPEIQKAQLLDSKLSLGCYVLLESLKN